MKRIMYALTLACVALLATEPAQAQMTIVIGGEARVIAAFPTGDFGRMVNTGTGFGIGAVFLPLPNYGLYGGYSSTEFDFEGDTNARATDSGFAVGITAAYPVFGTAVMPWLRSGLLFHDLEVRGAPVVEGTTRMGWEAHGGLSISVAPRLRLLPGIGFRTYTAPLAAWPEARISYVVPTLGLSASF